jgi:hypothetical protein
MTRPLIFATVLLVSVSRLGAQSSSSPQELKFQVSPASSWTDSGLDLQSGDTLTIAGVANASSTDATNTMPACDPKGVSGATGQNAGLPLASAPSGALIAKLHAHGALPLLIGASRELHVTESAHLFLGLNMAGTPPCQGSLTVTVRRIPGSASNASAQGTGDESKSRGAQLKSQLANAAQIFMSGQFGENKTEENAGTSNLVSSGGTSGGNAPATATPLKVSDAQLEADLRKNLDGLPRRVNDQFQNLGDMVNFVIVGSQKDVQSALEAANWHVADTNNEKAVFNALLETYEKKDYLQMPMSTLYLFGRKQDFGYEQAEPIAMVASRHHFRIWKAPFTWKGSEVWVGAGTHDIGFAKDKRNSSVTHKIDPAVDGERDNIGSSLQKSGKTKTLAYYLPPNPVQEAKNATGDGYHSDGRLLVIFLQ